MFPCYNMATTMKSARLEQDIVLADRVDYTNLIPGKEYELRLLPGLARWPYQLVLYRTPAGLATEGDYALDDGVPSDSSWVLALEYAADYDTMALLQ